MRGVNLAHKLGQPCAFCVCDPSRRQSITDIMIYLPAASAGGDANGGADVCPTADEPSA
jgi:hypothetical protein